MEGVVSSVDINSKPRGWGDQVSELGRAEDCFSAGFSVVEVPLNVLLLHVNQ